MNDFNEIKRVAKVYDTRASKSDSISAAGQWISKDLAELIIGEIIKKIQPNNSNLILEIGCGSGVLGREIVEKCQNYIGFDASRLMLKKFHDEHNGVNLIQASASHIPLRNDVFDKIVMNGVMMYFPNKEFLIKILEEIKRVSKNESLIFIGENIHPSKYYWELVWFENLSSLGQLIIKPYIRMRIWIAKKCPRFAGKWKHAHKAFSPKVIQDFFKDYSTVDITDASSYSIRKKLFGKNAKGNRRIDFLIRRNKK